MDLADFLGIDRAAVEQPGTEGTENNRCGGCTSFPRGIFFWRSRDDLPITSPQKKLEKNGWKEFPKELEQFWPTVFLCQLWFLSQSFSCFLCFFYWFLLLNLKLMLSFLFGGWGQEYEKNIKLQVGVGWSVESRGTGSMVCWESTGTLRFGNYSFSHNHGSGKLPQMKGNYYLRDPFSTCMIMGGSVYTPH